MTRIFGLALVFAALLPSCREKDSVTSQAVAGRVFNNCNDSGMAGVTVYLQTYKDNQLTERLETVSGADGAFRFGSVDIHSSDKYRYAAYIPSKSGDGAATPDYSGFVGTSVGFNKDQTSTPLTLKVTPCFFKCCLTVQPATNFGPNDSLRIRTEQPVYHRNVPSLPYSIVKTQEELGGGISNCTWANYPMGLWYITVEKWKNGNYTVLKDSVYLHYQELYTYTVNW